MRRILTLIFISQIIIASGCSRAPAQEQKEEPPVKQTETKDSQHRALKVEIMQVVTFYSQHCQDAESPLDCIEKATDCYMKSPGGWKELRGCLEAKP